MPPSPASSSRSAARGGRLVLLHVTLAVRVVGAVAAPLRSRWGASATSPWRSSSRRRRLRCSAAREAGVIPDPLHLAALSPATAGAFCCVGLLGRQPGFGSSWRPWSEPRGGDGSPVQGRGLGRRGSPGWWRTLRSGGGRSDGWRRAGGVLALGEDWLAPVGDATCWGRSVGLCLGIVPRRSLTCPRPMRLAGRPSPGSSSSPPRHSQPRPPAGAGRRSRSQWWPVVSALSRPRSRCRWQCPPQGRSRRRGSSTCPR